MNWMAAALALAPALMLMSQGIGFLLTRDRPPQVRWLGFLAIGLAGLALVLGSLLLTGTLVPASEFGTVMVKGPLPRLCLTVLLAALPVTAGLGWHIARIGEGQANRLGWLLFVGVVVAGWALLQVEELNPLDPGHARVYSYNLLWPPLLLWLWMCFLSGSLTVLRLQARWWRHWLVASLIVLPTLWWLHQPGLVAAFPMHVWRACLVALLPVSTGLGAWLALGSLAEAPPLLRRLSLSLIASGGGLVTAFLWLQRRPLPFDVALWYVWPVFPLVMGVLGVWALSRRGDKAPDIVRPEGRRVAAVAGLLVVGLSLVDLLQIGSAPPLIPLIVFMLGWTVLAEATASGPMGTLVRLIATRQVWHADSPVRRITTMAIEHAATTRESVTAGFKTVFGMPSATVAVIKAAVILLVVVMLSEVPNFGRTVIEPFASPASDPGVIPIGRQISDRALNTVALFHHALSPDALRLLPQGSRGDRPNLALVPGGGAAAADAFARGSDLDLGYIKVPAILVQTVSRDPVRLLLGVRVISGTVQTGSGGYFLLVQASTGETWRIGPVKPSRDTSAADVVSQLADELAFQIIVSTDRAMRTAGLTHSWEAFKHYRSGLQHWERYETEDARESLVAAVREFREATRLHSSFALAFYRLGLALSRDWQPSAAAEAFRKSLSINDNLIGARLALATTLYRHDALLGATPAPAVAQRKDFSLKSAKQARATEAHEHWLDIIRRPAGTVSSSDRATAFSGLCLYVMEAGNSGRDGADVTRQLAYYYCRRAASLYAGLPTAERATAPVKAAEATALNLLGVALQLGSPTREPDAEDPWHCEGDRRLGRGLYDDAALEYFKRAQALLPSDSTIRCNAASVALVLGRPELMDALEADAAARVALAEAYESQATQNDADLFRSVLAEYSAAIQLVPTLLEAVNGYAYAFWEWRILAPNDTRVVEFSETAEKYARQAVQLAEDRGSKREAVMARSTLGEVLLGLGRPHEAIEHLEPVLATVDSNSNWADPMWNEIRWDLAQAYICAGENERYAGARDEDVFRLLRKAVPLLDRIRATEEAREFRPFTDRPSLLDPALSYHTCSRKPHSTADRVPSPRAKYVLRRDTPVYGDFAMCDWLGVIADAWDPARRPAKGLVLRVWGGGIDRRIALGPSLTPAHLGSTPRNTRYYYFAQLEDNRGKPVSVVYSLKTFGSDTAGRCKKNLLWLAFDAVP